MRTRLDTLYRINDLLTALAEELHVGWIDDQDKDTTLNDLTHEVAERFRVS